MSEELRGEIVLHDPGHVHALQAPAGHLPPGHLSAVCQSEGLLPPQLALLPHDVSPAAQEQGQQNGEGGIR